MSRVINKRFCYINSGNQLSSTSNIFQASLDLQDSDAYTHVTLLQCQIPISYYTISQGYNTFKLKENNTTVTITIPIGNYNVSSFGGVVAQLLTLNSPNGLTYTITFPNSYSVNNTGLFTYTVNSISITVSLIMIASNFLNEQFGFNSGSTSTFTRGTSPSSTSTLLSTNVVSFVPESHLLIHCNLVNSRGSQWSDVLENINFGNNTIYGNQSWINPAPIETARECCSITSAQAQFSITDEYGTPIYFNGLGVQLSLMFFRLVDVQLTLDKSEILQTLKTLTKSIEELNLNTKSQRSDEKINSLNV